MARRELVYVAAGAGLGHVTRAAAVVRHLVRRGVPARIVSHSRYAEGLGRLACCPMEFIPAQHWVAEAPRHVRSLHPALVVLDTFPWGLRGEWRGVEGLRFATIARRLKVEAYLEAAGLAWDVRSPTLARVIVAEPLDAAHQALLEQGPAAPVTLPGRIRFPADELPTPVPAGLAAILDRGRAWLVVHSGPPDEIGALVGAAQEEMRRTMAGELAIVSPRPVPGHATWEYFPAARLYAAAARVVTGGGYNSVAELGCWPAKRLSLPFPRRYDDQIARLAAVQDDSTDGAPAVALALREMLEA